MMRQCGFVAPGFEGVRDAFSATKGVTVTTKLMFDLGGDERTGGLVRAVYRSL